MGCEVCEWVKRPTQDLLTVNRTLLVSQVQRAQTGCPKLENMQMTLLFYLQLHSLCHQEQYLWRVSPVWMSLTV